MDLVPHMLLTTWAVAATAIGIYYRRRAMLFSADLGDPRFDLRYGAENVESYELRLSVRNLAADRIRIVQITLQAPRRGGLDIANHDRASRLERTRLARWSTDWEIEAGGSDSILLVVQADFVPAVSSIRIAWAKASATRYTPRWRGGQTIRATVHARRRGSRPRIMPPRKSEPKNGET